MHDLACSVAFTVLVNVAGIAGKAIVRFVAIHVGNSRNIMRRAFPAECLTNSVYLAEFR